jgi:DNA-binding ferritin-like protein
VNHFWSRRRERESLGDHPDDRFSDSEREARLANEIANGYKAAEAVKDSLESVHVEATRLRDSREVAAALRARVSENGFTERLAASFRLRGSP